MIVVAGKEVQPCSDKYWKILRDRDGIDNAFLADPNYVGPFKSGGGKGGDLMAFTTDGAYIIKELGKGDHEALCSVTESYVQRIQGGQSLLVTIYLHFTDPSEERSYMVMSNILRHPGPWVALYDLKGCADDKTLEANGRKVKAVHKRIWHVHMWCGNCAWSDDRMTYHQGKVAARTVDIPLTAPQKEAVVKWLKLDTDWLAENSLMDYSLLVGIKRISRADAEADKVVRRAQAAPGQELRQPLVCQTEWGRGTGDITLVYIGIIDFLQAWTMGKKIAMVLKVMERNKATIAPVPYAARFYEHFERSIAGKSKPVELRELTKEEEAAFEQSAQVTKSPRSSPEDVSEEMRTYYSCKSVATTATRLPTFRKSRSVGCSSCFTFISG